MFPEDVLAAALLLEPKALSRNRHFALHASVEGTTARRRAARIRGLVRQITGAHGPARSISIEVAAAGEFQLRYRLAKVAFERSTRVTSTELAVLRVALSRSGTHLLPSALKASPADHEMVRALLAQAVEASREANDADRL